MSDSNTIRAAAERASDTPAVAPDSAGDGGTESGSQTGSYLPSFTKRQVTLVAAGVLVGVVVLLWLRSRQAEESQQPAPTESSAQEATAETDTEEVPIELPSDPSDPLAADEAVTQALRQSGTIGGGETDTAEDRQEGA